MKMADPSMLNLTESEVVQLLLNGGPEYHIIYAKPNCFHKLCNSSLISARSHLAFISKFLEVLN